ncbi:hypothetical protein [uncultured Hyphomicrobium sp.]|uniref:hypothetical protein n=1 Tax=uncultured Hyphomicrobium sp. TaxID=194373 RepID=UPI0025F68173|nr:hypothetical protein [uncultured Hyphomicrobium sp.]
MNSKPPKLSKEERLAKALRDNLARRKALVRTKRERTDTAGSPGSASGKPEREDAPS